MFYILAVQLFDFKDLLLLLYKTSKWVYNSERVQIDFSPDLRLPSATRNRPQGGPATEGLVVSIYLGSKWLSLNSFVARLKREDLIRGAIFAMRGLHGK